MRARFLFPLLVALLPGCLSAQTAAAPRLAVTVPDTIDAFIQREMRERQIPGLALAITRNGQILKQAGYGLASIEHERAGHAGDAVRPCLASPSSSPPPAIMMLAEEGKVDLDVPITHYLPGAPENWQLGHYLRHLLTHTSGLPRGSAKGSAVRKGAASTTTSGSPTEPMLTRPRGADTLRAASP